MKKLLILLLSLFLADKINSQILISPYIVYTDNENKVGNFIVQNESENNYEISISFMFGYPTSDSTGQIVMKYIENDTTSIYSINNFIRAFPKKFILEPKKRQVVRLTIKAPDTLKSGTYWTRIITSAVPYSEKEDTITKGITAKIKFVLNQVTTCMYRVNPAESGLEIKQTEVTYDSNKIILNINMKRTGNSPFIGNLLIKVLNENGEIVREFKEYIPVYFELQKKIVLENSDFELNKRYNIQITAVNIEKEDIPESNLKIVSIPNAIIPIQIPAN